MARIGVGSAEEGGEEQGGGVAQVELINWCVNALLYQVIVTVRTLEHGLQRTLDEELLRVDVRIYICEWQVYRQHGSSKRYGIHIIVNVCCWQSRQHQDNQTNFRRGEGSGGEGRGGEGQGGVEGRDKMNLCIEQTPSHSDAVEAHSCVDPLMPNSFLSKTQLLMINQLQDVSTRRSLSTAYRIWHQWINATMSLYSITMGWCLFYTYRFILSLPSTPPCPYRMYAVDKDLRVETSCS